MSAIAGFMADKGHSVAGSDRSFDNNPDHPVSSALKAKGIRLVPQDGSGIDACRTIRTAQPDTRVLFLTSFADDDAVLSTILAGADGFLLKEVSGEQLIDAVKTVSSGRSILDPSVTQRVLAKVRSLSISASTEKREPLSSQEERVLALVAEENK